MFSHLLWIGLGGFMGAVARFLIGSLVTSLTGNAPFPYGTLAVNVLGCLLIGLLASLDLTRHLFNPESRLLVFTGLLGAFTTFSTFSNEAMGLWQSERNLAALLYVGGSLLLGLAAVWIGQQLGKLV